MGIGIPFPNRMVASIFPCNRLKYGYIKCLHTAYMSKLDVGISGLAHKHIYNYTYMSKYVCKSIWMCLKPGHQRNMCWFSVDPGIVLFAYQFSMIIGIPPWWFHCCQTKTYCMFHCPNPLGFWWNTLHPRNPDPLASEMLGFVDCGDHGEHPTDFKGRPVGNPSHFGLT